MGPGGFLAKIWFMNLCCLYIYAMPACSQGIVWDIRTYTKNWNRDISMNNQSDVMNLKPQVYVYNQL